MSQLPLGLRRQLLTATYRETVEAVPLLQNIKLTTLQQVMSPSRRTSLLPWILPTPLAHPPCCVCASLIALSTGALTLVHRPRLSCAKQPHRRQVCGYMRAWSRASPPTCGLELKAQTLHLAWSWKAKPGTLEACALCLDSEVMTLQVCGHISVVNCIPHDVITVEGRVPDRLYIVRHGSVQLYRNHHKLDRIGPGCMFGEMAMLGGCRGPCAVLRSI